MPKRRSWAVIGACLAVAAGTLTAGMPTADAVVVTTVPGKEVPLSGNASPMGHTNGFVQALAYGGGVVYAGGSFTTATSTSGSAQTRNHLAAFSSTTGALLATANLNVNGAVRALNVSPDGSTLYLGGAFTTVNGSARNHIAAIDIASNTLKSWNPNINGNVYAITSTSSQVFAGGVFTQVGGSRQRYLASLSPSTGGVSSGWTGDADGVIYALALSPDLSTLVVGGGFTTLAGQSEHALGSVTTATGAARPWNQDSTLPNTMFCTAIVKDLSVNGGTVFVAGEGAQGGCYDGTEAADIATGNLVWRNPCEGATQTVQYVQGVVYKGSHMHDCAYNPGPIDGGFTGKFDPKTRVFYHLSAEDPVSADGDFEHWGPVVNTAEGPLAMATDGSQLFVGGEFTTVNKVAQAYIARFSPKTASNNAAPTKPSAPTAVASNANTVTVTWPATTDVDSGTLTYRLYRSGTLIYTTTAESWMWTQPTLRYNDTGRATGSTAKYTVTASDGVSTTAASAASNTVTVAGTTPNYDNTVNSAGPSVNWRLGDSGGTAADSSGNGNTGQFVGGVTTGAADDRGSNGAVSLDGTSGYVTSATPQVGSAAFTESAWFKTSTAVGGAITGFSSDQSGNTGGARAVWMDNDGQVVFSVHNHPVFMPGQPPPNPTNAVRSDKEYNDGHWHFMTATYSGTTLNLYIDGASVGTNSSAEDPSATGTTGYWRAGYMDLRNFNLVFGFNSTADTSPSSFFFNGSIDDAAFYTTALSASQVSALWAANAANAS